MRAQRRNSKNRNRMRNTLGNASASTVAAMTAATTRHGKPMRGVPHSALYWAAAAARAIALAMDELDAAEGPGCPF